MKKRLGLLIWLLLHNFLSYAQSPASAPVYTPSGGTFAGSVTVVITNSTASSLFFCTIDGSTPDISSSQFAGSIVINSTSVLKCVAAVPGVNQKNAQNNNPNVGGTYWKLADCSSSPGWSSTTAYAVGARVTAGGNNYIAIAANTNKPPTSNPASWSNATSGGCTADDPGGDGIPSLQQHTSGNATPSVSGASMLFAETAQANHQTNILWPVSGSFGSCPHCTNFYSHWKVQIGTNIGAMSSWEADLYDFAPGTCTAFTSNGCRFMYGMQYCYGAGCPSGVSGYDLGGNSNVPWTYSGVSTPAPNATGFLDVGVVNHRLVAEETSRPCSSSGTWPYLYYDKLILNGATNNLNKKFCANALPVGWGSVNGFQFQIDIGSHSSAQNVKANVDTADFLATFPPSNVTSSTFTIGTPVSQPQIQINGNGATFSGSGASIQ